MEHPTLKRLLRRLRELRKRHDVSQEVFSELSGISYKYYQAVEAGRKKELRLSTLERLAKAYGIEVYQLLSPDLPNTKLVGMRRPPKRKQDRDSTRRK